MRRWSDVPLASRSLADESPSPGMPSSGRSAPCSVAAARRPRGMPMRLRWTDNLRRPAPVVTPPQRTVPLAPAQAARLTQAGLWALAAQSPESTRQELAGHRAPAGQRARPVGLQAPAEQLATAGQRARLAVFPAPAEQLALAGQRARLAVFPAPAGQLASAGQRPRPAVFPAPAEQLALAGQRARPAVFPAPAGQLASAE